MCSSLKNYYKCIFLQSFGFSLEWTIISGVLSEDLILWYYVLSSSSSGIEQESLPTVSSSVNLRVSGTHRCSPLVYLHLKRSLFLQLKLYTWGPCLATGGANHKLLDVYICLWLYWITQHCDYDVHVLNYALSNKLFEFEFE